MRRWLRRAAGGRPLRAATECKCNIRAQRPPGLPASGPPALTVPGPGPEPGKARCRHCGSSSTFSSRRNSSSSPTASRHACSSRRSIRRQADADKHKPVADEPVPEVNTIPDDDSTAAHSHGMDRREASEAAGTSHGGRPTRAVRIRRVPCPHVPCPRHAWPTHSMSNRRSRLPPPPTRLPSYASWCPPLIRA